MKDVRIDGKLQRVFVLKEKEDRIVYIPVKALHRKDYERLKDIEQRGGEMMKEMHKTTLDNGRNALELYDNIIQVVKLGAGTGKRLRKPDEDVEQAGSENAIVSTQTPAQEQAPAPVKRGRGRPPKSAKKVESQ